MGNKQLNKKKTSRKRQLGRFQQTMELTKRRKLDNFTAEHDTTSLDYIELQNMEMESPISSTTDIQSNDEATGSNILNPRIAQVDDTYRVPSLLEEEDTHELQISFNVEEGHPDKTVSRRIVADPLITHPTHISGPDSEGLRASWRTLRVYPDDYETHRGYLALRCRATVPTRPPNIRAMSVRLYVATRPHISTYMFSKNKAAAGCARHRLRSEMIVWTLLLLARRRVPLLRD
ncbi:uncharacterized protein LOC134667800 [Cydia fagiglandana]|uniref:uncharacterized protein LOC134667800 n=1 Tax=Cydia fagiglandana TaxID=1458189 RepID=UPI002FEE242E